MNTNKSRNNPIFQQAHVEGAIPGKSTLSVEPAAEVEAVEEGQTEPTTESASKVKE
jgi:hypothetical protein